MISIYRDTLRNGSITRNVVLTIPTENYPVGSVHVENLMRDDYIEIPWRSSERVVLDAGSYILYDGERYLLTEPYVPNQKDEVEYDYRPRFHSVFMSYSKIPMFLYTRQADGTFLKEPDWSYTGGVGVFLAFICDAIRYETAYEGYGGDEYTAVYDATDPDLAQFKTMDFKSTDVISALNLIASTYKTEWVLDKATRTIHLGKAGIGARTALTVGGNVTAPRVSRKSGTYATRFYAFGSSRNVEQDYVSASTNNLVNKRLTLDPRKYPGGYRDVDCTFADGVHKSSLLPGQVMQTILVFEDIYPRSSLMIASARPRLLYSLDADKHKVIVGYDGENPVYDMYALWYVTFDVVTKDGDGNVVSRVPFEFDGRTYSETNEVIQKNGYDSKGMLVKGKDLSVNFTSGRLSGYEFGLTYYPTRRTFSTAEDVTTFTVEEGEFEIVHTTTSSKLVIPTLEDIQVVGDGLVPRAGDDAILFNIKMPYVYYERAYAELENALVEEMERRTADLDNYTVSSYVDVFRQDDPGLYLGRNVSLVNGGRTLESRVIGLKTSIDIPYEIEISIGNEAIKGNTQDLRDEVVASKQNISVLSSYSAIAQAGQSAIEKTTARIIRDLEKIAGYWKEDPDRPGTIYTEYNTWSEGYVSAFGASDTDSESDLTAEDIIRILNGYDAGMKIKGSVLDVAGGGSGGSGIDADQLWNILGGSSSNKVISSSYLPRISNAGLVNSSLTIDGKTVSLGGSVSLSDLYLGKDDSAASAARLATKRLIWGQEFDGTQDVKGALSNATTGNFSSRVTASDLMLTGKRIYFGDTSHFMELTSEGHIRFSDAIYSDSFVSAFGASDTDGGGEGATNMAGLLDVDTNPGNDEQVKGIDGNSSDDGKTLSYNAETSMWEARPAGGDKTYVHTQGLAASKWTIIHNMGKRPNVSVVNYQDEEIEGDVKYIDNNSLTITFDVLVDGKAYLN